MERGRKGGRERESARVRAKIGQSRGGQRERVEREQRERESTDRSRWHCRHGQPWRDDQVACLECCSPAPLRSNTLCSSPVCVCVSVRACVCRRVCMSVCMYMNINAGAHILCIYANIHMSIYIYLYIYIEYSYHTTHTHTHSIARGQNAVKGREGGRVGAREAGGAGMEGRGMEWKRCGTTHSRSDVANTRSDVARLTHEAWNGSDGVDRHRHLCASRSTSKCIGIAKISIGISSAYHMPYAWRYTCIGMAI